MVCQSYAFKDTIYLGSLKLLNILVMFINVFMLFVGYELYSTYYMDPRFFLTIKGHNLWPIYTLPLVFIGIGGSTLITCIFCFICSIFQSKRPVIGYAIIMIFVVLAKFGCLFITFKAQGLIERKLTIDNSMMSDESNHLIIRSYYSNEVFRKNWDILQNKLRCCGVSTYKDFYLNNGSKNCFPPSCNIRKLANTKETCTGKFTKVELNRTKKVQINNPDEVTTTTTDGIIIFPNPSSITKNASISITKIDEIFTSTFKPIHASNSSERTKNNLISTPVEQSPIPQNNISISKLKEPRRKKYSVAYLWKKIHLLGCVTALKELYGKSLIRGKGFLLIEIGLCTFILIEFTALALAFAYALNPVNNKVDYDITDHDDDEEY